MTTDTNNDFRAMPVEQFDRIAAVYCRRWSKESITMAKDMFVNGMRPVDVAQNYDVKQQQASAIKKRFADLKDKDEQMKVPLDAFMKKERPAKPAKEKELAHFSQEVRELARNGYSPQQILKFLTANGIKASAEQLNEFLGAN